MAKVNRAKELTDIPVGKDDPISELSDIMKFDPVEAALEQTGDALQLDLEHELMGDLADTGDDTYSELNKVDTKDTRQAGIPGTDNSPANGTDDEWGELSGEDLDGTFEELFDQTLEEEAATGEPAGPTVPQELESQLNDLLAGLGAADPIDATRTEVDEPVDEMDADNGLLDEISADLTEETFLDDVEMRLSEDDGFDVGGKRDEDGNETVNDDRIPDAVANGHDSGSDPLSSLAAIVGGIRTSASKHAAGQADVAPAIETSDIVDEAVPVEDDLDIPDVSFENDIPQTPDFDDLDAEFSQAFNKLTGYDKVESEKAQAAYAPKAEAAEPHLGERLDGIFAEMSDFASTGNDASGAYARKIDGENVPDLEWNDDIPADSHESPSGPAHSAGTASQGSDSGGAGRGILIAMIVAAIAVAGGIGAFALSFGGGDETSGPALVKADDGPVKVKPKDPGGKMAPNEDMKVYERVAGTGNAETPTQEKLISTEEEPVDVAVNVPEPRVIVPNPVESTEPVPAEKNDDRILQEIGQTDAGTPAETLAIKPRRVKTLIVRPDGTLLPREVPEPAVTNELRTATAETPEAATVAEKVDNTGEAASKTGEPVEIASVTPEGQNSAEQREVTFQPPAGNDAVVVEGGSTPAPDETAPAYEGVVVEGIPLPTPAPRAEIEAVMAAIAAEKETQRSQPVEAAPETVAPAKPEPVVAATEPVPTASSEWWVQISSQPSRESAQASYAELASRYGSIIGGRGVNIVRADIEGKGTYYRVRIAGGSRNEAAELCNRLKGAGAGCFVARQ